MPVAPALHFLKMFCFVRRACLLLSAALLLLGPLSAAGQVAAPPAEGRAARGFLWEAKRGGDRVLLLGAIHVGRPDFAALDSAFKLALMQASVVVFEANVFDAKAAADATQRIAMYPQSAPGLEARVDKDLLARIDKIIGRAGGDLTVCCRMKPWMLANTLVVLESIRAGYHPAYGSEARLYQLAQATGKRITEIEGVGAQLRLFDEVAEETQLDYLRHTVETIESGASRTEIERLLTAWERGDAAVMERLLAEMARGNRPAERFVFERIIKGRHPVMLAAIEQYAGSGDLHLVALGALHFFGPDGLLKSLRERGFAVRRLP